MPAPILLRHPSVIDVAIGMSFTFFVLALFASAINEAISFRRAVKSCRGSRILSSIAT